MPDNVVQFRQLVERGDGWLKCNGATFDPARYPELYRFRKTTKLPDTEGCWINAKAKGVPIGLIFDERDQPLVPDGSP